MENSQGVQEGRIRELDAELREVLRERGEVEKERGEWVGRVEGCLIGVRR